MSGSGGSNGSIGSDPAGRDDCATRALAASVAGRRARVAAMPSVERRSARVVPATPAPVARTIPASVAPVTRISPATNRNTARMSAPAVEIRCEVTHSSPCPTTPPRVSNAAARQNCAEGTAPGPTPSVPAASASVIEHVRQITPVRSGRPGGRSSRTSTSAARDDERGRDDVSERAEHEPQPGDGAVAQRAAVPTAVGHPSEQDADRDQAEPEDVDVMGLELDVRQPQRRPASQQRARRALGRRLLSLAGGHFGGTGFDAPGPLPPKPDAHGTDTARRTICIQKWRTTNGRPECWSSRTTTRSRRSSSARCAWRATRCESRATGPRRSTRPTGSCPTC